MVHSVDDPLILALDGVDSTPEEVARAFATLAQAGLAELDVQAPQSGSPFGVHPVLCTDGSTVRLYVTVFDNDYGVEDSKHAPDIPFTVTTYDGDVLRSTKDDMGQPFVTITEPKALMNARLQPV